MMLNLARNIWFLGHQLMTAGLSMLYWANVLYWLKMIESVFPLFFLSFIKKICQKTHFAKFQMVQCGLALFWCPSVWIHLDFYFGNSRFIRIFLIGWIVQALILDSFHQENTYMTWEKPNFFEKINGTLILTSCIMLQ